MSLAGKTIVVTRGASGAGEWQRKLKSLGAKVYNLPTIAMSPVEADASLAEKLSHIDEYDWLVFTSSSGIHYLLTLSAQLGVDIYLMDLPKIAVVGSRTASTLTSAGLAVAFEPSVSDSIHLADELNPIKNKHILLLRTTIASDDLPTALKKRGAHVTDLRIYKTELLRQADPEFSRLLKKGTIDYITFASPSAVAGFMSRLSKDELALARSVPVVSIGSSVTAALHRIGFTVIYTAPAAALDGMVETLKKLSV